ncbi:MAG: YHS domain-containing protein [Rhodospirillales bacterium]|nr:YHS domain-containing protein [Rhodospirillales bacterium]
MKEIVMAWLSQNWIWIVGAIALFLFMSRMGGCGMGRSRRSPEHSDRIDDRTPITNDQGFRPVSDPVSGHSLASTGARISSVYHDRAYFFESAENRNEFEAHPEKYAGSSSDPGVPVGAAPSDQRQRHHHRGC